MYIDDIVIFAGEMYKIKWIYESGYCEIQQIENYKIELVEVQKLKKTL
ncbi:hypothetical protein ACIFOT_27695 [Neobacillus sp. NRS-1170]